MILRAKVTVGHRPESLPSQTNAIEEAVQAEYELQKQEDASAYGQKAPENMVYMMGSSDPYHAVETP